MHRGFTAVDNNSPFLKIVFHNPSIHRESHCEYLHHAVTVCKACKWLSIDALGKRYRPITMVKRKYRFPCVFHYLRIDLSPAVSGVTTANQVPSASSGHATTHWLNIQR